MNELKYVIVLPGCYDSPEYARAIIFNGLITHKDVGEAAAKSCDGSIISAGFMHLTNTSPGIKCYGESESLGIKSNPVFDEEICMNTLLKMHPYF